MKNIVEIVPEPLRKNKFDNEFVQINISGRFEKSEIRHLIEKLDFIIHH
jgi:hypothetical protein